MFWWLQKFNIPKSFVEEVVMSTDKLMLRNVLSCFPQAVNKWSEESQVTVVNEHLEQVEVGPNGRVQCKNKISRLMSWVAYPSIPKQIWIVVFCDTKDVVLSDLPQGQTLNTAYYVDVLERLWKTTYMWDCYYLAVEAHHDNHVAPLFVCPWVPGKVQLGNASTSPL